MSWVTILDISLDSDSDLDSNLDLVDDTEINDNMSGSFTHLTLAVKAHSRPFVHVPTQATATHALHELEHIIWPLHKKGDGYCQSACTRTPTDLR